MNDSFTEATDRKSEVLANTVLQAVREVKLSTDASLHLQGKVAIALCDSEEDIDAELTQNPDMAQAVETLVKMGVPKTRLVEFLAPFHGQHARSVWRRLSTGARGSAKSKKRRVEEPDEDSKHE